MATFTIPKADSDKFSAYVKSISSQFNDKQKAELAKWWDTAKKLYDQWKAKENTIKVLSPEELKVKNNVTTSSWPKEWHITTVQNKQYIYQWGKYVPYNNISWFSQEQQNIINQNKEQQKMIDAQNKLKEEQDKLNKQTITWDTWVQDIATWPWTSDRTATWWFADAMSTTASNVEELWQKANEAIAANLIESAAKRKEELNKIYWPALAKYEWSLQELLSTLDQVKEQNQISLEQQRRIANDMRETAWVQAMIANSKVWPWLSASAQQALARDITQWYAQAISTAEWNYETARINTWERIKNLWLTQKEASDALTQLWVTFWLAEAEPILTALTTITQNKNDLINKVNWLQSWTQEALYTDAEWKYLSQEAYRQRQNEWDNAKTEQDKINIINSSIPKDANGNPLFFLSPTELKALTTWKKDWWSVYNIMNYTNWLNEQQRLNIYAALGNWSLKVEEANKMVQDLGKANISSNVSNTAWSSQGNIAQQTNTTPTTVSETWDILSSGNSVATYNQQNPTTPIVNEQTQNVANAQNNVDYLTFINWLSEKSKNKLDEIRWLSQATKNKYIQQLEATWTANAKYMIQYINNK